MMCIQERETVFPKTLVGWTSVLILLSYQLSWCPVTLKVATEARSPRLLL